MTTAPSPSATFPNTKNRQKLDGWRITGGEVALAFFLCLGIAAFGLRRRQRRWSAVLTLVALALIFADAGCGGGGGGGGGGGNPGTPTGVRAFTVSMTINGVTQTVPGLTVNVQ
jgi:hypothetical protein